MVLQNVENGLYSSNCWDVIAKKESRYSNVDQIITYLKDQIASNPVAAYIGEFDHYAQYAINETMEGWVKGIIHS